MVKGFLGPWVWGFNKPSSSFPEWLYYFTSPSAMGESSNFSTPFHQYLLLSSFLFTLKLFISVHVFVVCMCPCAMAYMWGLETACGSWFSPSSARVAGLKLSDLGLSVLAAYSFSDWAISPSPCPVFSNEYPGGSEVPLHWPEVLGILSHDAVGGFCPFSTRRLWWVLGSGAFWRQCRLFQESLRDSEPRVSHP